MIPSILFILYFSLLTGQSTDLMQETALLQFKSDIPSVNSEPCRDAKIAEVNAENWKTALASFQNRDASLQCIDPQNAFSLIDQIINHNAGEHYSLAERLYFQSLTDTDEQEHIELIKGEAHKVIPLLEENEQKEWASKIKKSDTTLARDINRFWTLRDPVLSTKLNERLIEHWQRIAYSRKEFSRNTESVYHTDDRGTIYVKYGAPSYKRSGMLFPDNTEIRSKLYDLSFFKGGINPREMLI